MKAEVNLPPELVDAIAEKVAAILQPRFVESSPWLDVEGASSYTGLSVSTLYKNLGVPRHKAGGRLAFRKDELDDYMSGQ